MKPSIAIEVLPADLQGPGVISCPRPTAGLWNLHPKVYLDLGATGEVNCPYCGTLYRLQGGAAQHNH